MNYKVIIKSAHFRCCCYVTAPNKADARMRGIAHITAVRKRGSNMTYSQWIQFLRKNLDSIQYSGSEYHHKVTSAVLDAALLAGSRSRLIDTLSNREQLIGKNRDCLLYTELAFCLYKYINVSRETIGRYTDD
jgi:hypothetical protein